MDNSISRSSPLPLPSPASLRLGWKASGARLGLDPAFGCGERISSAGGTTPGNMPVFAGFLTDFATDFVGDFGGFLMTGGLAS